jgi:hypothetical protein
VTFIDPIGISEVYQLGIKMKPELFYLIKLKTAVMVQGDGAP